MDSLLSFTGMVFNFTILALFAMFAFKFIQTRKNSGQRNQIQNLNAKLSMLRMTLKSKIKNKSYKYRSLIKVPVTSGDPVDLVLNEMLALSLENGDELQRYFDISKKINSILITQASREALDAKKEEKEEKAAPSEPAGTEDYMGTDLKSEIHILRLIKEMVDVSKVLNKRIENFNLLNTKQQVAPVNALTFPSMAEVNRAFKNRPDEAIEPAEAA